MNQTIKDYEAELKKNKEKRDATPNAKSFIKTRTYRQTNKRTYQQTWIFALLLLKAWSWQDSVIRISFESNRIETQLSNVITNEILFNFFGSSTMLFVWSYLLLASSQKQSSLLTPNTYVMYVFFLCLDLTLHKNKCRIVNYFLRIYFQRY